MATRAAKAAAEGAARGAAAGAGEGEDRHTQGRKALPPQVFTILEPKKEKKGGGGFRKWTQDVK